jgi:hypothetical protein
MPAVADTMLIDSGPTGKHLHVVVWGPGQVNWLASLDQVILASVTTLYPNAPHDPACILAPGDHEFVTRDSWIYYRKLRVDTPQHVDHMIASGQWAAKAQCSAPLLQRIQNGLCQSRQVDRRFRVLLGCL